MLTKKNLPEIYRLGKKYQKLFGLNDWEVSYQIADKYHRVMSDMSRAECATDRAGRVCMITFNSLISKKQMRRSLKHEMLELLISDMDVFVCERIKKKCRSDWECLRHSMIRRLEKVVSL